MVLKPHHLLGLHYLILDFIVVERGKLQLQKLACFRGMAVQRYIQQIQLGCVNSKCIFVNTARYNGGTPMLLEKNIANFDVLIGLCMLHANFEA